MQTKKTLILVRHAKSSWEDLSQRDFDRPLNDRGRRDASEMSKRIHKNQPVKLDAIIASPAKRTFSTAKYFAEEFNIKKKNIIEWPQLYEASPDKFYKAVESLDDSFTTVALFSHNPGITEFANELTNARIDNIPTCGVFAVHIKANSWKDFEEAEKEFWFFDYPKNL